jgi:SNF2 family DNA or RNA helicase
VTIKLDPKQREALDWLWPLEGAGLFGEQGTGKTWIALALIERMLLVDLERPATPFSGLAVVPLTNLESTWLALLKRLIPLLTVVHTLEELKKAPHPRLLLVHYEGLRPVIKRVKRLTWSLVIFDESHRLNKRSSIQSRMARFLRNQPKRLALSGTPIEQAPQDVWAQMRFIDHTVFGESWSDFDGEYLKRDGYMGHKRKFRREKMKKFLAAIQHCCLRIDLADVADVKSQLHVERFNLFGEQDRVYRELDHDMVTRFNGERAKTPLRITTLIRLQQVTGGHLTLDSGESVVVGQAKMRKLRRLVETRIEPPFVVFCRFKPEIIAVYDQLLKYYPRGDILWGKTGSGKDKAQVRGELNRQFQGGELDFLVCQSRTGGVGVDLFRARHAILYSMGFSYIDYTQARARLIRRGQLEEVELFFLAASGTIDDDILLAIEKKTTVSHIVLSRLKG